MNKELFYYHLAKNKKNVAKLAKEIGIERNTLYTKLRNQIEFKQNEIIKISSLLKLTKSEMNEIFFNDFVDETITK